MKLTIEHYKALRLEAYADPAPLTDADINTMVSLSPELSPLKQPVAHAFAYVDADVVKVTFTGSFVTRVSTITTDRQINALRGARVVGRNAIALWKTPLQAMIACRNAFAIEAATKLASMDRRIAKAMPTVEPDPLPVETAKENPDVQGA